MRDPRLFLVLLLAGCDVPPAGPDGACPPAFVRGDDAECVFSEDAVAELMQRFDQGELVLINREPFPQITDPDVIRNVWITPLPVRGGLDTVDLYRLLDPDRTDLELPLAFPVGTVIVHERVDGTEGSTVQVRREAGFENEGEGPWWFGKFYPDGSPDLADCNPCFMCHNLTARPGTEGLWGVPREMLADPR